MQPHSNTHALHISNREIQLEHEQILLVNQHMNEVFAGEKECAEITLKRAAEVNAQYDQERNLNAKIANAIANTFIQNNLS